MRIIGIDQSSTSTGVSIFDDEEDLFKEKTVALPEATVNQTDENKARAETKVSRRED